VLDIFEDSKRQLWIGTENGGLNRFNRDLATFERFVHDPESSESIASDHVLSIAEGRGGFLWIGTSRGLSRLDPSTMTFETYLPDQDSLGSTVRDVLADRDGSLWLASVDLLNFDPATGQFRRIPLELDATGSGIDGVTTLHRDESGVMWAGSARVKEPRVTLTTRREFGRIQIRVSDNGPGVPKAMLQKIFEPFFTTKATGEGTGLGLSLAHDIITDGHTGMLSVGDGPEGGAEFVIDLPG
jgi:streptogramin lyase